MSAAQIETIPLDLIVVGDRLRPVDKEAAKILALSMEDKSVSPSVRVQINPVTVRPRDDGKYLLVTGGHRLAAAKHLGWTDIQAVVKDLTDDEAQMEEVDENLYRADIADCHRTEFLKRKVELFTFAGGKLRRGRKLGNSAKLAELKNETKETEVFYTEIKEKFGFKRRTAERILRRAQIPARIWELIKKSPESYNGAFLDKILEEEGRTPGAILKILDDRGCTLREAVKIAARPKDKSPEKPLTPDDAARALAPAWDAWSPKERALFIKLLKARNGK